MLKLPRPGSLGASTSMPPPASCSPLSGKSSWNTNTESFDGGKGFGCTNTLNCAGKAPVVAVHTTDPAAGTQAIGAPPMPWPQLGVGLLKQMFTFSNENNCLSNPTPSCGHEIGRAHV